MLEGVIVFIIGVFVGGGLVLKGTMILNDKDK